MENKSNTGNKRVRKLKDPIFHPKISVDINLLAVETQCPICLETLNNTWTVMACLHRFCNDCFHRSLRMDLGPNANKECPLCRVRLASRRASRPDPAFDSIVEMLKTAPSLDKPSSSMAALSKTTSSISSSDDLDIDYYRQLHLKNVENFKKRQRSNPKIQKQLIPQSQLQSAARRNTPISSHCHDYRGVSFVRLELIPSVDNNNQQGSKEFPSLRKPYLRLPQDMRVQDLKLYLNNKFHHLLWLANLIFIQYNNQMILLKDDTTLVQVCSQYWVSPSPLTLQYNLIRLTDAQQPETATVQ